MNFKSIGIGAAIATATAAATLITSAPAQALGLSGLLSIDLAGRVPTVRNTGIDFKNEPFTLQAAPGSSITGSFAQYAGGTVTIKDLEFSPALVNNGPGVNINVGSAANPFLTIQKTGLADLTFTLNKLLDASFSDIGNLGDAFGNFDARLEGVFKPSGIPNQPGVDSIVSFRLSGRSNGGSIELTPVPVPTPALVPAALGFGAAMLRKRKGEQAEAEKETAEAKA